MFLANLGFQPKKLNLPYNLASLHGLNFFFPMCFLHLLDCNFLAGRQGTNFSILLNTGRVANTVL